MKNTDIKPACGKLLDEWDTGQPTSEYIWTRFGASKEDNNGQLASLFQSLSHKQAILLIPFNW